MTITEIEEMLNKNSDTSEEHFLDEFVPNIKKLEQMFKEKEVEMFTSASEVCIAPFSIHIQPKNKYINFGKYKVLIEQIKLQFKIQSTFNQNDFRVSFVSADVLCMIGFKFVLNKDKEYYFYENVVDFGWDNRKWFKKLSFDEKLDIFNIAPDKLKSILMKCKNVENEIDFIKDDFKKKFLKDCAMISGFRQYIIEYFMFTPDESSVKIIETLDNKQLIESSEYEDKVEDLLIFNPFYEFFNSLFEKVETIYI